MYNQVHFLELNLLPCPCIQIYPIALMRVCPLSDVSLAPFPHVARFVMQPSCTKSNSGITAVAIWLAVRNDIYSCFGSIVVYTELNPSL